MTHGSYDEIPDILSRMPREKVVQLLEGISIQCYDHESTEALREAAILEYRDGTLSADAVRDAAG